MRITNNTIVRNYNSNLNKGLGQLNRYSNMVYTGRQFTSMSENAAFGVRALQIRRSMESVASYQETAESTLSKFDAAEDQMLMIVSLGQEISARYTNALNGTNGKDEHEAFISEITQFRDEILACANGRFSDRFLFGGTTTDTQPFTTSADGKTLYYNGVDVSTMTDAEGNLLPDYQYLFDDAAFVDIGLGIKNGEDGLLVESSAFKNTLNGLDFLGYGEDNMYLVCNQIIEALESDDFTDAPPYDELLNKIQTCYKNVTLQVTELGAQTQYLKYTTDRLETESINLAARQDAVEFMDPAEAIMQFKMQEYVYNAALQMGQRLLQPTLFNFIN